jgi:hypothetical protein
LNDIRVHPVSLPKLAYNFSINSWVFLSVSIYTMESSGIITDVIYLSTGRAKFSISVISIKLFTSALIAVTFLDENDKRVDRVLLKLTGGDYAAWQEDDNYLVTYVNNYITTVYMSGGGGGVE